MSSQLSHRESKISLSPSLRTEHPSLGLVKLGGGTGQAAGLVSHRGRAEQLEEGRACFRKMWEGKLGKEKLHVTSSLPGLGVQVGRTPGFLGKIHSTACLSVPFVLSLAGFVSILLSGECSHTLPTTMKGTRV